MIEQAQEYMRIGEFAKAEELYLELLANEPDNPKILYLLSVAVKRQNRREEELSYLQKAYVISPEERFVLHGLGNAYLHQGNTDQALEYFEKEIRIDPNYPQGHAAVAYTHLRQGNWQQAEQSARTALRASDEHQPTMLILAAALLEQGKADKAINYYQRVIEIDPNNGVAMEGLGQAFMLNGQAAFAAQCCRNALELDPSQANVLQLLGSAEQAQEQWENAAEAYAMALELSPESLDSLAGLAGSLSQLGQLQQAESLYMRLLKLDPQRHAERLELSRLFIKQAKYRKIAANLQPLLGLPADHPDRLQGYVIVAQGQLLEDEAEVALRTLQPALDGVSVDPEAQLLHVEILTHLDQPGKALKQLAELLMLKNVPSRARLMAVQLGSTHGETEQLELALEQLYELEQQGKMSAAQTTKANKFRVRVHHRLGQYSQALAVARQTTREAAKIVNLSQELEYSGVEFPSTEVLAQFPAIPIADGRSEPIFLLAWPGTGRQKLLAAMQAHPAISIANESPQNRRELLLGVTKNDALEAMSETDIRLLRKRYWRRLKQALPDWDEVQGVVDAQWLPVEALPMVYRLFPQARIVILDRDEADMELSWSLYGYPDISTMLQEYQQQSQLLIQAKEQIPANFSEFDWDQLSAAPESELKRLFADLKLPWDAAVIEAFKRADAPMVFPAGDWKYYQGEQS